jgi:uncharacterized membrane protein YfcA
VGLPRLPASVTNSVALVTMGPGAAAGSRPELRGQGPWLRRWSAVTAAGGGLGAALLLWTPPGVFSRVVPFLIAFASVALFIQPWVSARRGDRRRSGRRHGIVLAAGLFAVSLYAGYFGAGAGVMVLALLLLTVDQDLPRANALKNVVIGGANVIAALGYIAFGPIDWSSAVPLSLGLLAGSLVGPMATRRVPPGVLRTVIGLAGLGLAVDLWVT